VVVASALPRRGRLKSPAIAILEREVFPLLLFVNLDVAARYDPSVAVGEIWSGHADEERVLARIRLSIITGVYSVRVAGSWLRSIPRKPSFRTNPLGSLFLDCGRSVS